MSDFVVSYKGVKQAFLPRLTKVILSLLGLTMILFFTPGINLWFMETLYISWIYPFLRGILDILFGFFSTGFFWIFVLLALSIPVWLSANVLSTNWASSFKALRISSIWVSFFCSLLILFYWFWGYNYLRFDLATYLGLELKQIKENRLKEELTHTTDQLLLLRTRMGAGTDEPLNDSLRSQEAEALMQTSANELFSELRLSLLSPIRTKSFRPQGFLLRLRTLGFYMPFTGECYADPGIHPIQMEFIKAHEWTHAQGITDEGDANFLAYLICVQSEEPYTAYAGYMEYFRYLLSDLRKINPELYNLTYEKLPQGILADLQAIRAHLQYYPEWMPRFRDAFYNTYLVVHGVREGTASYDRLVRMVIAYQRVKKL